MSKEQLTLSGWIEVDGDDSPSPFDIFVQHRNFTLKSDLLVSIPEGSIGLDFNEDDESDEFKIRKILVAFFKTAFANEKCYAIDVNHKEFEFKPSELEIDEHGEPWPFRVKPWAEYIVIANSDFSHGVFSNPRNNHMVVFGSELAAKFAEAFPQRIADAKVSASRPNSKVDDQAKP